MASGDLGIRLQSSESPSPKLDPERLGLTPGLSQMNDGFAAQNPPGVNTTPSVGNEACSPGPLASR